MKKFSLALLASVSLLSGCNSNPLKCTDDSVLETDGKALYVLDLENGYFKSRGGNCYTFEELKQIEPNRDLIVCDKKTGDCEYGLTLN